MKNPLVQRRRQAEWMDAPDADPEQLQRSLSFIRRVNFFLGYTRATIGHLRRFSNGWKPGERITILDVATGSGDIPAAILKWARRKNFEVQIVGIDLHEATIQIARHSTSDPRFSVLRADALRLPFADESFDYVLTAMFLHHLDEESAVQVLAEMKRVARRGMIAADLLRNRRAFGWIKLFTLAANPMVKHDARVSVEQAFNANEVDGLRERAGWDFAKLWIHFAHRFVLVGERKAGDGDK